MPLSIGIGGGSKDYIRCWHSDNNYHVQSVASVGLFKNKYIVSTKTTTRRGYPRCRRHVHPLGVAFTTTCTIRESTKNCNHFGIKFILQGKTDGDGLSSHQYYYFLTRTESQAGCHQCLSADKLEKSRTHPLPPFPREPPGLRY